jgi:hypothetical protein
MTIAHIKKIEESGIDIILEVRIIFPEKPTPPNRVDFVDENRFINAEANYHKRLNEWKEIVADIELLHIGLIELKQGGD